MKVNICNSKQEHIERNRNASISYKSHWKKAIWIPNFYQTHGEMNERVKEEYLPPRNYSYKEK